MKYFLGLDNGGTTTKASIIDACGNEIAVERIETEVFVLRDGYVERDMEEMWKANVTVIQKVLQKASLTGEEITGIGICGHGKGLYTWPKENKPLRNGILSTDHRADEIVARWKKDGTLLKASTYTLQNCMACQPVTILAWLKENEPDSYHNIQWIFSCKDYIRFRLTNKPCAELTDASGNQFINLETRQYDDRILEAFDLMEIKDALPPLCTSGEIAGVVSQEASVLTGLKEGTPVIGGMFDIDACAIGSGVIQEDFIAMIAGTWSINEYIQKEPVRSNPLPMNSLFCLPEYYLVEESSPTSAGNHAWFNMQFLKEWKEMWKEDFYDKCNQIVSSIPPEEFVPIFLPFVYASNVNPNAKGCFIGITGNHTRAHFLRSIYEGIVFSHRYHYEKLLKTKKTNTACIRLSGGAAHSEVWTQMFADILHCPIETVRANETGALGCAVLTAVATHVYPDIETAVKQMCHVIARYEPNPTLQAVYDKKYQLYCKTIEQLDGLWDSIQEFIEE